MAGLLGDVLPYLYSRGNALQRRLNGLLDDPLGTAQQAGGLLQDNARQHENLLAQAFQDPRQPFRVTDSNALQQASMNALSGLLGFAPAGITAWHGSPHTFDRFDASKIGTGEGAQAYGHGVYLAESPQTAEYYKSAVTSQRVGLGKIDGKPMSHLSPVEKQAVMDLKLAGGDVQKAIRQLSNPAPGYESSYAARRALLEEVAAGKRNAELAQGNLYKVDLPDDAIARMLDYDKPLSQQPQHVQQFFEPYAAPIRKVMAQPADAGWGQLAAPQAYDPTGRELMSLLAGPQEATAAAVLSGGTGGAATAHKLRAAGIPGIRYLDGGSRVAGQGSSNFVVFPGEENALKILERNGQPLR